MPSTETLNRFVARVEANAHAEAVEEFYAENCSMRENQEPPRIGRDLAVANERKVLARAKAVYSKCVPPLFVQDDQVVIRWIFRFEWLNGTITEMEELAYQRWESEQIMEEQFFYDPAQRIPRAPTAAKS